MVLGGGHFLMGEVPLCQVQKSLEGMNGVANVLTNPTFRIPSTQSTCGHYQVRKSLEGVNGVANVKICTRKPLNFAVKVNSEALIRCGKA